MGYGLEKLFPQKNQVWKVYSPVPRAILKCGMTLKWLDSDGYGFATGLISCWFIGWPLGRWWGLKCAPWQEDAGVRAGASGACVLFEASSHSSSWLPRNEQIHLQSPLIPLVHQPSSKEPCGYGWKPSKLWTKITFPLTLAFSGNFFFFTVLRS